MGRQRVIDWEFVTRLKDAGLTWKKIVHAVDYDGQPQTLAKRWSRLYGNDVSPNHIAPLREEPKATPLVTGWCDYSGENIPESQIPSYDRVLRKYTPQETKSLIGNGSALCVGA